MTERSPIECAWTGEVFKPTSPYQVRRAAKDYPEGEVVRLVEMPERSTSSHSHLFAVIDAAHESLPPLMAERFPTPLHLRKYLTVKAGHCYSESLVCSSKAEAERVASFTRSGDEFALVTVNKNVVTRFMPKSLSRRTVPSKAEFQQIKDAVLRVLEETLEVTKKELNTAGQAA